MQKKTDPDLALRLAEQAMMISDDPKIFKSALDIYLRNNFYKNISYPESKEHDDIGFSEYGDSIIFRSSADDTITISPNGKFTLTYPTDSTTNLCDLRGNIIQTLYNNEGDFYFLPNNELVNIAIDDDLYDIATTNNFIYISSPSQYTTHNTVDVSERKNKARVCRTFWNRSTNNISAGWEKNTFLFKER